MAGGPPVPFYAAQGEGTEDRVLLLSYHFPPGYEAGALRWQKFARFASERGWTLDVVTLAPESLARPDRTRLAELPPGTRVYGVPEAPQPIERLGDLLRKAGRRVVTRGIATHETHPVPPATPQHDLVSLAEVDSWNRFTPDAALRAYRVWRDYRRSLAWSHQAAEIGTRIVVPELHRAVISCGPPHEIHDAGRIVASRAELPFVMDLRDPWSLSSSLSRSHASPLWLRLARRLERPAVQQAAIVTTVTEPSRDAMRALYPSCRDRIFAVMNGYDDEPVSLGKTRDRFVISYAGWIYLDRDPTVLFRAAARVVRQLRLQPRQFGVEFMGEADHFGGVPLETMARREGLDGFFRMHSVRSRQAALAFLAEASVLVSLPQEFRLAIPSKLFEYMRLDSWILAFADRSSATELLLRDTEADVISTLDVDRTAAVLEKRYKQFVQGVRPAPLAHSMTCSRENQAHLFFDRLEAVTGSLRTRPRDVVGIEGAI